MTPGRWGQIVTCVVVCALLARWLYALGFFRGFRRGQESETERVTILRRIEFADSTERARNRVAFASAVSAWRARRAAEAEDK